MMAVHSNTGSALPLGKLGLALGKRYAVSATTSTLLALSLGAGVLVTVVGALFLVGLTDFETSDKKKSKAGQT
jgi:hypothetical protein